MSKRRYISLIVVATGAASLGHCTHHGSQIKSLEESSSSQCEQMTRDIFEEYQKKSTVDDALTMTSKGVAYSATAAGYILDYTVIAGLGIVTLGAMCPGIFFMTNGAPGCLPLDVLSSTRQTKRNIESSPDASPDQQPKNEAGARPPQSSDTDDDLPSGALGPRIYKSTKRLREDARSVAISRAYRMAARCFANRADQENLMKAYQQMKWLSDSPLYDQVSKAERHQINEQTVEFKNLLLARYPSFEQDMERKNRELVVDLLKNAAASADWQNPRDGSLWRLLNVTVLNEDVAKITCSYLGEVGNKEKKFAWRLPSQKELEKALASGMLAANPAWATGDQELQVFATSSASPPKAGRFSIKGKDLTEISENSSTSKIICVY